jgi:hypothetical protein
MPASSIQTSIRDSLQSALSGIAANVYDSVPEAVIPPFCALVPNDPYLQPNLIGQSVIKVQVNLKITAAVTYMSNSASLDNLEKLIISILAVIPSGYIVGDISVPSIVSVGSSNLLSADIPVSTYYTQTN